MSLQDVSSLSELKTRIRERKEQSGALTAIVDWMLLEEGASINEICAVVEPISQAKGKAIFTEKGTIRGHLQHRVRDLGWVLTPDPYSATDDDKLRLTDYRRPPTRYEWGR